MQENYQEKINPNIFEGVVALHGNNGSGKTTFGRDIKGSFFLDVEHSANFITGIRRRASDKKVLLDYDEKGNEIKVNVVQDGRIHGWVHFVETINELCEIVPDSEHLVAIIDTIDVLYDLYRDYMFKKLRLTKNKMEHETDLAYGKGWDIMKKDFIATLNKLHTSGYGILILSHTKTREIISRFGKYERQDFDFQKGVANEISYFCNTIFYLGQNAKGERTLFTKQCNEINAKCQMPNIAEEIIIEGINGYDAVISEIEKVTKQKVVFFFDKNKPQQKTVSIPQTQPQTKPLEQQLKESAQLDYSRKIAEINEQKLETLKVPDFKLDATINEMVKEIVEPQIDEANLTIDKIGMDGKQFKEAMEKQDVEKETIGKQIKKIIGLHNLQKYRIDEILTNNGFTLQKRYTFEKKLELYQILCKHLFEKIVEIYKIDTKELYANQKEDIIKLIALYSDFSQVTFDKAWWQLIEDAKTVLEKSEIKSLFELNERQLATMSNLVNEVPF
jgi:hypothetical protein